MGKHSHFEICVQTHFSAAHHLRGYPGNCRNPHGHNWTVEVYVEFDKLNEIGIGIDFRDIKNTLRDILEKLDHNDLNVLPQFEDENPSSENIAKYLYRELKKKLNDSGINVTKIRVSESPTSAVLYWEN